MATIPEALAVARRCHQSGDAKRAEHIYRQILQVVPDSANLWSLLGAACQAQGKIAEAVACCRQALQLDPDYADAHNNLGVALSLQGNFAEALASFEQVLRRSPHDADAHKNRALVWLALGDYERGWPEYEWRRQCSDPTVRSFPQPSWEGSPLAGRTILLHTEQGLGDTLQFLRYAALVQQRGGKVIVECPAPLVRLLSTYRGLDHLVGRGSELPPFDVQAPFLSLPALFQTTLANIPVPVPYLFAELACQEHWSHELGADGGFKVGINWHGNLKSPSGRDRAVPLHHFASLARIPGVRLYSLQKGAGLEELHAAGHPDPIIDLGNRLDETTGAFVDTAAVMKNLDLVITSDTAIPHLAGAPGVPVWVALPHVADSRWLLEREDSPWYPTMRLFRQSEPGNWEQVFARITAALAKLVS